MAKAQKQERLPVDGPKGQAKGQKSSRVLIAVLLVIIVAAVGVTVWHLWPQPRQTFGRRMSFYTVDEGATFFVDDAERLPPFDHGGKSAVRAILFSCDGGKTRFVGYFEKLPEEALQKLVDEGRDLKTVDDDDVAGDSGWLAKRPGDAQWTNSKNAPEKYGEIRKVVCPNGGTPVLVRPDGD